jgi:hypothetical protein
VSPLHCETDFILMLVAFLLHRPCSILRMQHKWSSESFPSTAAKHCSLFYASFTFANEMIIAIHDANWSIIFLRLHIIHCSINFLGCMFSFSYMHVYGIMLWADRVYQTTLNEHLNYMIQFSIKEKVFCFAKYTTTTTEKKSFFLLLFFSVFLRLTFVVSH